MLKHYFPILLMMILSFGVGFLALSMGRILGGSNPNREKSSRYECGFEAFGGSRLPFDVRFYLVAILFIIFDLETAFLFPWAMILRQMGWMPWLAMMLFLLILVVAFIYEWKSGALEWE